MGPPPQISRRHHYVPRLLLRPWLIQGPKGHSVLRGHYWDAIQARPKTLERGLSYFCQAPDLFSLTAHPEGMDIIERRFFKAIDDEGALSRDVLLKGGPAALSLEERRSFVRLLLSLETRRPSIMAKLRTDGADFLGRSMDDDEELRTELARFGISERPSQYWELERTPF